MDDDQLIDGELVDDDSQEPQDDRPAGERFWSEQLTLPPRKFGQLLAHIREEISSQTGQRVTQETFGEMLGNVNQVTISRWQRGEQRPQREQLVKIVMLAEQYGLKNVTLARLQQSLKLEADEYLALDARLRRIDDLLSREDENFKAEYYETMVAIYHLLRGTRRDGL